MGGTEGGANRAQADALTTLKTTTRPGVNPLVESEDRRHTQEEDASKNLTTGTVQVVKPLGGVRRTQGGDASTTMIRGIIQGDSIPQDPETLRRTATIPKANTAQGDGLPQDPSGVHRTAREGTRVIQEG